jgi:hypothetical protein
LSPGVFPWAQNYLARDISSRVNNFEPRKKKEKEMMEDKAKDAVGATVTLLGLHSG